LVVGADDYTGWSLELGGGRVYFWVSTNQGWQYNLHPTVLTAGQWYHVAATYSSGTIRTFVNGTASAASSAGTLTQGPWMRMGGLPGYAFFNGVLDEMRISSIARYTGNFTIPSSPFVVDANTVDLWRFDEGAGQIATDSAGAANNASLGTSAGSDSADPVWVMVTR
jgi:hypothetical protein